MRIKGWLWPALISAALVGSGVVLPAVLESPAHAATTSHSIATRPLGIDVSDWQHVKGHSIDWEAVKAHGVSFAFIKATEGPSFVSRTFADDWESSAAAGLVRGAYHFARPSQSSAKQQAHHFVAVVGGMHGRGVLPPVLDLEESGGLSPHRLISWVGTWLHVVQKLSGRHPIIYSYPAFWSEHMNSTERFRYERLWGACYCSGPTTFGRAWKSWNFWQSSSSGHIAGINGRVDVDRFAGSMTQLRSLANMAGEGESATQKHKAVSKKKTKYRKLPKH